MSKRGNRDNDKHRSDRDQRDFRPTHPTFGFPCSRPLAARFRTLQPLLQVDLYELGEQALEDQIGLVESMNIEERQEMHQHLVEHHGVQRMIENLAPYDEETATMLRQEWNRRYQNEETVRQIVNDYVNRGMKPEWIRAYIEMGVRYMKESRQNK